MRLPNLILAGAPRCGTSSLFSWLVAHPEICGSSPKETFYFMDANHPLLNSIANYHHHGLDRYASFFQDCSPQAKILFEATTHYIYQETALNFFAACQPQPYIVFILRKPSEQIFSSFSYTQNNLARLEKNISFTQFTDLLLQGRVEQIKDRFHSERSFFFLKDQLLYCKYYDFIARWAQRFPSDQLRILLFEQMKLDPRATLRCLASDLDIDPNFYNRFNFQKENQTITIKNSFIQRNLRKVAPYLPAGALKAALRSLYFSVQLKNNSTPSPDPKSLHRLDDYFIPHNRQLAQAFNLNLDCWK